MTIASTLRRRRRLLVATSLLLAATTLPASPIHRTAAAPPPAAERAFHLRLTKSEPAKAQVLTASPTVIRLWYSLPPEMAVTAVKLSSAEGTAMTLGAPRRGSGAKDPVEVDVKQPLPAGDYIVSWKTSSKDGHPITGDFTFTVKAGA